jgi:hypothetical protein
LGISAAPEGVGMTDFEPVANNYVRAMDTALEFLKDDPGEFVPASILRDIITEFVRPDTLWTVIDSLRKGGHFIEGDNARGYRLIARSPVKLTDAQVMAIKSLSEAGGSGSIQAKGVILAAGQMLNVMPETWLRLMTVGLIEGDGPGRIRVVRGAHA